MNLIATSHDVHHQCAVLVSVMVQPIIQRCAVAAMSSPFVHFASAARPEDLATHLGLTISLYNMMLNIGNSQIYDVSHLEDPDRSARSIREKKHNSFER